MRKPSLFLCTIFFVFAIAGMARAELILFEDFEDSSGFTIGSGNPQGYWGVAPLSGTASLPSYFVTGGGQSGNIFYGSYGKDFSNLSLLFTMTIGLPDLSEYTNTQLTLALAACEGNRWEITHRDSLTISGSGTIDSFLPQSGASPLISQVYSIALNNTFRDFTYDIDSGLTSLTFTFGSTDYYEVAGIDSVRITGDSLVSVPDASILLLLGSSLMGLGVFSRKSKGTFIDKVK